jgi:hypothetical protein
MIALLPLTSVELLTSICKVCGGIILLPVHQTHFMLCFFFLSLAYLLSFCLSLNFKDGEQAVLFKDAVRTAL